MQNTLIRHCRYLVTGLTGLEGVIEDGAVLIQGSQIYAVGSSPEIEAIVQDGQRIEVLDADKYLVMPGLVDAHNHLGEAHTLLIPSLLDPPVNGIVDAMERIYWPAYAWLTDQSAYDLTLFGLMHILKHGATTHADAMIFPEAMVHASIDAKARSFIHPQMISSVILPDSNGEDAYLANTKSIIEQYHGSQNGLISIGVHPNGIFNSSHKLLIKGKELADRHGVCFATHIAEAPDDKIRSDIIYAQDGGLVPHIQKIGLLGPNTILFHGTLLDEREIDLLAETDTGLVHCPATNSWFGYCAYLPYMLEAGLRVGLGSDCVTHNLFDVMLSVLQHHNIMPRKLQGVDPFKIFQLATIGGADVLGISDQVGTLEPEKKADLITIDLEKNTGMFPLSHENVFSMLALNGAGMETADVMIDGEWIRRAGAFTFLDEERITANARAWCQKFEIHYRAAMRRGEATYRRLRPEFSPPLDPE